MLGINPLMAKKKATIIRFIKKTMVALIVEAKMIVQRGTYILVTNCALDKSELIPADVPSEKKKNITRPTNNSREYVSVPLFLGLNMVEKTKFKTAKIKRGFNRTQI